jgi:hypothetical protein
VLEPELLPGEVEVEVEPDPELAPCDPELDPPEVPPETLVVLTEPDELLLPVKLKRQKPSSQL